MILLNTQMRVKNSIQEQLHCDAAYSTDIGIPPWETYITSSTNICMVHILYNIGDFKPYNCNLYRQPLDLKYGRQNTLQICLCHIFEPHVAKDE